MEARLTIPQIFRLCIDVRLPSIAIRISAAMAITMAQIVVACLASGNSQPLAAWRSLYQWDGGWYANIVEHSYVAPGELGLGRYCSIGFFPGYPLLASVVMTVLRVDSPTALLLTAQAATALFWFYLLQLLRRGGVPSRSAMGAIALAAVHPGAFFLIASYSESLFLASLTGFLYWSQRPGVSSWIVAAAHGALMTSTRLVGLPLVVLPLLLAWSPLPSATSLRRFASPAWLALVSTAGAAAFFAFLEWRFGRWDLYLEAQRTCWGVAPDYLALFRAKTYGLPYLAFGRLFTDVAHLNRMIVPLTLAGFALIAIVEWRTGLRDWRRRIPFYFIAAVLFFIPVCSYASLEMLGMIRYGFCVHVFLVLILLHQVRNSTAATVYRFALVSLPGNLFSFVIQLTLIWRFTQGLVVA